MTLYGGILSSVPASGLNIALVINFRYPVVNAATYEGNDQPITPPVELTDVEFRLTDNILITTNPDDPSINYYRHFHGTGDHPAADLINGSWVGRIDKTTIVGLPVRSRWFYQMRSRSRSGVQSDWSPVYVLNDNPPPIPKPVITSLLTDVNNRARLAWTDVSGEINGFDGYNIHRQVVKSQPQVSTKVNALIVNMN